VAGKSDLDALLAPFEEPARRALEDLKKQVNGKRLGYNIGSMKNLNPRTLAREGLVDLPFFEELGFDLVMLVQGDDRPERVEAVRQTLDAFGCRAPLAVFGDTVFFGDLCRRQACDLVYASDHLREVTAPTGIGFVNYGSLEPGLGAIDGNLERVRSVMQGKSS
jgi:hypothetical protein